MSGRLEEVTGFKAKVRRKDEALEAVLLFLSTSHWDAQKSARWRKLTGSDEATTVVLCELVRKAKGDGDGSSET